MKTVELATDKLQALNFKHVLSSAQSSVMLNTYCQMIPTDQNVNSLLEISAVMLKSPIPYTNQQRISPPLILLCQ